MFLEVGRDFESAGDLLAKHLASEHGQGTLERLGNARSDRGDDQEVVVCTCIGSLGHCKNELIDSPILLSSKTSSIRCVR